MTSHLYWDFIKTEATVIESDGCTKVIDFHKICCWEHDLSYYWAACPRDAYRLWRNGAVRYWQEAKPITRSKADQQLRKCYQQKSIANGFSVLAWTRWTGTRVGGFFAWKRHRERERLE